MFARENEAAGRRAGAKCSPVGDGWLGRVAEKVATARRGAGLRRRVSDLDQTIGFLLNDEVKRWTSEKRRTTAL